jgi:chromosome segregation ATPase
LRRISGQNRKAIEQLDNELSSARQEYREIHALYQVTMEEIRSMESKLFATHQSITARVKQRQILETQNEEINGIIHPI